MSKEISIDYNTPVLTSKYVVGGQSEIVYVAHHEDGTWEFWGSELIDETEIIVLSWKEIIQIDSSVLEVAELPVEFNAIRDGVNMPWQIVAKN